MMPSLSEETLDILAQGELEITGKFLWGSNYTFFTVVNFQNKTVQAVYKPTRGERPLWDFPTASLGRREAAAYVVSQALGWGFVPPTVYRKKAPLGPGSLQLFIEHDPDYHYFNFTEEDRQRLKPVVAFDILINNADRKGSHILVDAERNLWLIDHGLCFHVEEKLRTVIWVFAGQEIPGDLCADLEKLYQLLTYAPPDTNTLVGNLRVYLSPAEVRALARRVEHLVTTHRFPLPDPDRRPFPWPQL